MGLTALGAKVPSLQQSANLADQLQLIKDLLSAPINTLVDDSSKIKEILEQIESQLPESLRVKLWPAGHLPFFRAEVKAAQQRIELRHSQIPLKADIAQKCKLLNQLNVLAYYNAARWISSALITRLPTCSGNTS